MAIVFDETTLNWYTNTIVFSGSTVSSPNDPGDVFFGATKVHGLTGFASETILLSSGLGPDSDNFENNVVPLFQTTYAEAFHSQSYTQGPGQDSTYTVFVKEGYRVVSDDGTFVGTASPGTQVNFFEGKSVTGINTSHNGGTAFTIRRDNGV